jgi:DNA-binding winged helix-turn-helix (wHTH) protein/tetratricopeptide (TPR) repeat protein
MSLAERELYEFGPFSLDPAERLISRAGVPVALTPKVFDTLVCLVRNRGRLLTKDELLKEIWPGTFVEEVNLAVNISTLRKTFGENPQDNRYIETVPGRGYRFVAHVRAIAICRQTQANVVEGNTSEFQLGSHQAESRFGNRSQPTSEARCAEAGPQAKVPGDTRAGTSAVGLRVMILSAAAVLILGLGGVGWLYYARWAHALAEKDTVVLADFANSTGDTAFDDTLRQALAVNLEQSPFLNILPDRKVSETLKLMGRGAHARLDQETALELCQRAGSKAVLAGSVASLGSQYVIGLNAVNCQTGDSLARNDVQASRKEDVLRALGKAGRELREKLGESLSSIEKFDAPLEQATTPSIEALKAYTQGRIILAEKGDLEATIAFYKRAVELDPNFAMGYAALGAAYQSMSETALAAEDVRRAFELRERVSEREKLRIAGLYHDQITGDLAQAVQTYQIWAREYPHEWQPRTNLGVEHGKLGKLEESLADYLEALRLNPDSGVILGNLMETYVFLHQADDARALYGRQVMAHNIEAPLLHIARYHLAFLEGDRAEMESQVGWAAGKAVEGFFIDLEADTAAFHGRRRASEELAQQAVRTFLRSGLKEPAAGAQAIEALAEAEFGYPGQARAQAKVSLELFRDKAARSVAALALARTGEAALAQAIAKELREQFPLDTLVQNVYSPAIEAQIALNRGDAIGALHHLEAAVPYGLSYDWPMPFLYSIFLRGNSYLRAGDGKKAQAEFQTLLDHSWMVVEFPHGALGHLGLARAYAMQGDTAKSRAKYEDFFTLWKDADPGLPILKEAKAEYAKLH